MRTILSATLLFCLSIFTQASSQVKDAPQNLKQQASKMGVAFIKGDYKTFASYTYPSVVKMMGGAGKMVDVLKKITTNMKNEGVSFDNTVFDEPSKIEISGKELQATIKQHTEIITPQGILISTSTLIAISTDNGSNWSFVDTSNKDMATIRKVIPGLSKSIYILPQLPPVRK
jgi:hypothetical protein